LVSFRYPFSRSPWIPGRSRVTMLFAPLRAFCRAPAVFSMRGRFYSVSTHELVTNDIRSQLMNEVKTAMKNKDAVTSTTLRSILAEVYAADKASNAKISTSIIANILRKAVIRRTDAASKFAEASRPDLADKENREVEILSKFLPPLLPETEIDRILNEVIKTLPAGTDPRKSLGIIFKGFYAQVDKSTLDTSIVKQRAEKILAKMVLD